MNMGRPSGAVFNFFHLSFTVFIAYVFHRLS
jgi:hypothetical protein